MTLTEKVAYLKGLAEGLCLDDSKGEVRLIKGIIKVLDEMALSIADVEDNAKLLSEQIDAVDEDLDALEMAVYDEFEDECEAEEIEDGESEDEDNGDEEDFNETMYEVECPACSEVIYLDESILSDGHIDCPNCGENLEFDLEGLDAEETDEEKE